MTLVSSLSQYDAPINIDMEKACMNRAESKNINTFVQDFSTVSVFQIFLNLSLKNSLEG